jgi:uncharacterized membrane protein YuzA (DUF378 family)
MKRNTWEWVAFILVVIGGINWGLVGLLNLNLVGAIFGFIPGLARIIFVIVGIAAVYMIYGAIKQNKSSGPTP